MGLYAEDRAWSDRLIDEVRTIVGPHLLKPTPFEMDCKQAADLYVFTAKNMTIAARVRRHGYADRYPYEFTVRSERDSGAVTELSKILDGWGDWFFYGHADAAATRIPRWWLIDLDVFRTALLRHSRGRVQMRFERRSNRDGTHFVSYDLRSFKPVLPILVGSSHALPSEARAV